MNLLRDWLSKHIQHDDKELAKFLIARTPAGRGLAA